jgi:flagellar hook-associated protein 3 FlgL
MQISTKLFNEQQVGQFSKLNEQVQTIQEKIASGKSILKASDDPLAAVNLSAAKEQQSLLGQYKKNIDAADRRLSLADSAIQESINVLTRISEITVQAANGTYGPDERLALLAEAKEMTRVMVEIANTRDAQGQSLFAGYQSKGQAFSMGTDGQISYLGDRGTTTLQVSENLNIATSIDGGTLFERVESAGERKSVFELLEAAAYAIDPANDLAVQGSARGMADLTFDLPRDPQEWEFNLTGSAGSATITASLADGKYDDVVSEINLMTSVTGIVASYNATTDKLRLTDGVNGEIILKDIQIEGVTSSERSAASTVSFASLDGAENEIGVARILGDHDLIIGTLDNDIERAIAHFSVQQAFIGAQMSTADRQMDIVEKRQIAVSQEVADIGDADLAALVTELQAMLVNKDAAQQAFAKIGQQSLFDFIR